MHFYCYVYVFLLLCMFWVLCFIVCCSMFCLCVNVYCTAATGCQPNCYSQIISYIISLIVKMLNVTVSYTLRSPITGLEWPRGFQEVKVPRFHDNGTGWW